MVQVEDALDIGKPESRTAGVDRAGGVQAVEAFEDLRQRLFRNSATRIAQAQNHLAVVGHHRQSHRTAGVSTVCFIDSMSDLFREDVLVAAPAPQDGKRLRSTSS